MSELVKNDVVMELRDVHVVHQIRGKGLFGKDSVYALTGANVKISRGETIGIVGESGCGKSTMAKVLVGMQKPTRGEVLFNDKNIWTMPAKDRRDHMGRGVAMVFQDASTALNRRMPVQQVIADPLIIHGIKTVNADGVELTRDQWVRRLMQLVGLPASVAEALPSQLSGGQRQRVAIARALALQPSLVIADEPTSALDVSVRAQILNLLIDLRESLDLALIFVSHDIQTVKRMSDRVLTMYLGRLVENVPAEHLPLAGQHPYTRALFSATPSLLEQADPIPLVGPVPSAVRPPSGCPFRTRCWRATDVCATEMPASASVSAVHDVACYHPVSEGTPTGDLLAEVRKRHMPTIDA